VAVWKRGWRAILVSATGTLLALFALAEIGLRLSPWEGQAFAINELPVPGLIGDYGPDQRGEMVIGDEARPWPYRFTTNSQGFRGPEIDPAKPDGLFRILAVGDSYTWGDGVGDEDVWVRKLEERLQKCGAVEVINAGFVGRNTVGEADWLRDKGMALSPDLVLLAAEPGDAMDILELDRDYDNRAAMVVASRPAWLVRSMGWSRVFRLWIGGKIVRRSRAIVRPTDADGAWERLGASMVRVKHLAGAGRAELLVLGIAPGPDEGWTLARLEQETTAAGVDWFAVAPQVDARGPEPGWWEIPGDGHYTAEGNAVIADVVAGVLAERGLIPPSLRCGG
jgi:hypothetical protein